MARECIHYLENIQYLASYESFCDALRRCALKSRQACDQFYRLGTFLHAHEFKKTVQVAIHCPLTNVDENTCQYYAGRPRESHEECSLTCAVKPDLAIYDAIP
jgi:hypothetical protein